jgi:Phage integrase family
VILAVLKRANELREQSDQPPILAHVTPHTFRRTYITFMLAAGFDVPYVQAQAGHRDPAVTLAVYTQVIRRPDRDRLRADMRGLLGEPQEVVVQQRLRARRVRKLAAKRHKKAPNASCDPTRRSPQNENPALAGASLMELAGLEPATSWVRSRRSPN